jgi:hypothetical protein
MNKSLDDIDMDCPKGEILRKSYTRRGKRIPAACIPKVISYPKRYSDFQKGVLKKAHMRLRGWSMSQRGVKRCGPGQTRRKPYVRQGKGGLVRVPAACISKQGSQVDSGVRIGPIRQGDLTVFGYSDVVNLSKGEREAALRKAVAAHNSLSIWKKLNVLFIFNKNKSPELSDLFREDRDWIQETFGIKA